MGHPLWMRLGGFCSLLTSHLPIDRQDSNDRTEFLHQMHNIIAHAWLVTGTTHTNAHFGVPICPHVCPHVCVEISVAPEPSASIYLKILCRKGQKPEQCTLSLFHEVPAHVLRSCLLYTSPSPRDATLSRMPSSA